MEVDAATLKTVLDERWLRELVKSAEPPPTGLKLLEDVLPLVFVATIIIGIAKYFRESEARNHLRRQKKLTRLLEKSIGGRIDAEGALLVETTLLQTKPYTDIEFRGLLKRIEERLEKEKSK